MSGAISLRKQKRLSILFLNHISQDQNLISQARLQKAKVKTTNNASILPTAFLAPLSQGRGGWRWGQG